jgi:hypothetical protein
MIKKLTVLLLFANFSLTYAQTIKTDVLVIGNTASGAAAAIQCARSKLKTILAIPDTALSLGATGICIVDANRNIPSGIWGEFRRQVQDFYKKTPGFDTAYNAPLKFAAETGTSILRGIADSVKNLTQYTNSSFTAIKKDGDYWEVTLIKNGEKITVKTRVVVDATADGDVVTKAGAKFAPDITDQTNSHPTLYRTSIAVIEAKPGQLLTGSYSSKDINRLYPVKFKPMNSVLVNGADNILCTERALPGDKGIAYLPLQLELGQGVGTMAAFCAFFKTNTTHLKVRIIQGELLDFGGYLVPFTDVKHGDPAWRAVQQVAATGILKGTWQVSNSNVKFVFKPDSLITTAEIQPGLTEIYTRAFLWFGREKPGEKFTLGNLLSFISDYTLTEPQVLKMTMQKNWKTQYKFKLDFDLNRQVTRREFAVLTNKFLNPFARTVDLSGRLVN